MCAVQSISAHEVMDLGSDSEHMNLGSDNKHINLRLESDISDFERSQMHLPQKMTTNDIIYI